MPAKKSTFTCFQGMPTRKAMRNGTPKTMLAVPMSGSNSTSAAMKKMIQYGGALSRSIFFSRFIITVRNREAIRMPVSLANSAGCTLNPAKESHRLAPLTTWPTTSTRIRARTVMIRSHFVMLCQRW